MANDIDMWNDIEHYEKDNRELSEALLAVYYAKFMVSNDLLANRLRARLEKRFKFKCNYW